MQINSLEELIKILSKLPGLGPRSAKRAALYFIKSPEIMIGLSNTLKKVSDEIKTCDHCGNIDITSPCNICSDNTRDKNIICVVEHIGDLWAIEKGKVYKGLYHVLGGTLSALDNRSPKDLNISNLSNRIKNNNITEVIIATNATLEGETTGHYVAKLIEPLKTKITRLAHGIPVGAELDYVDEGTLSFALQLRQNF